MLIIMSICKAIIIIAGGELGDEAKLLQHLVELFTLQCHYTVIGFDLVRLRTTIGIIIIS